MGGKARVVFTFWLRGGGGGSPPGSGTEVRGGPPPENYKNQVSVNVILYIHEQTSDFPNLHIRIFLMITLHRKIKSVVISLTSTFEVYILKTKYLKRWI